MNIYPAMALCPIFRGLSIKDLESLMEGITFQTRSYDKDIIVANHMEDCNRLMIVLQGNVKGEMMDASGKSVKIEDMGPGKPLASAFLFGSKNRFPVDVITTEPCQLLIIPRQQFLIMMQRNQMVLENYLFMISSKAQFLSEKIRFLTLNTIRGKLAQYLLGLVSSDSNKITLLQTQQEISDLFGIARPSLARSLAELEADGIIKVDRKEIQILNKNALIACIQS